MLEMGSLGIKLEIVRFRLEMVTCMWFEMVKCSYLVKLVKFRY